MENEQPVIQVNFEDVIYTYRFGNAQDIGRREEQQDSFGYSDLTNLKKISGNGFCAVLADGMGGFSNGKEVSGFVVEEVLRFFKNINEPINSIYEIEILVNKLNEHVLLEFANSGLAAGSTLAMTIICKDKLLWCTLGDTRVYLCRDNHIFQLNEDHTYKVKLLENYIDGKLPLECAFEEPQRESLTSYIGTDYLEIIDFNKVLFSLQNKDKIMLCSDGVYNSLNTDELVLCLEGYPQLACEKIVEMVLEKGIETQDNMTVMIMQHN